MPDSKSIALANRMLGNIDPTAGVILWPRQERCPRCGCDKGRVSQARPGLCRDCSVPMTVQERAAWAA